MPARKRVNRRIRVASFFALRRDLVLLLATIVLITTLRPVLWSELHCGNSGRA